MRAQSYDRKGTYVRQDLFLGREGRDCGNNLF